MGCNQHHLLVAGIGAAMLVLCLMLAILQTAMTGQAVYYMFAAMQSVLPWTTCDNEWNGPGISTCSSLSCLHRDQHTFTFLLLSSSGIIIVPVIITSYNNSNISIISIIRISSVRTKSYCFYCVFRFLQIFFAKTFCSYYVYYY
jgi:hypothetical protein